MASLSCHMSRRYVPHMASLLANNTWTLEKAPLGITPIPVKRVFEIKRDSNGEGYKAQLVAKKFRQCDGMDCEEVLAPMSKLKSLTYTEYQVLPQKLLQVVRPACCRLTCPPQQDNPMYELTVLIKLWHLQFHDLFLHQFIR